VFPGEAEHLRLVGVRGEQLLQFCGGGLQKVSVAGGVEGFEDKGDEGGVLGDARAVGIAVVPVAGQYVGGVGVDDLPKLGVFGGVGFAERREGLGAVGVADLDAAGDVVEVEGAVPRRPAASPRPTR